MINTEQFESEMRNLEISRWKNIIVIVDNGKEAKENMVRNFSLNRS